MSVPHPEPGLDPVSELDLVPTKAPIAGACPECGANDLRRYVVFGDGGWWDVVKCQTCLASASRTPWNRLGWVTLPEDTW